MHASAIDAAECGLQVQHARPTRSTRRQTRLTGLPFDLRLALRIGVAELQVRQLHRQSVTFELPAYIGRQLAQRQARLRPQARQLQGTVFHRHTGFAACLVDIEHNAGALNPGQ